MPIPDSYVDNVNWSVAQFEHDQLGDFFPVPWTFQKDGTVEATNQWKGKWVQAGVNEEKRITINLKTTTNQVDKFAVHFLTLNRFIATKSGKVYRYGKKL
jgi:hypothetical protein